MKKVFSTLCAFMMSLAFSVTAFAGAPVLFEQSEGIINTGGEGLGRSCNRRNDFLFRKRKEII